MGLLKSAGGFVVAFSLIFGTAFLQFSKAQDNRWLSLSDISAIIKDIGFYGMKDEVTISFYIKNISDGGIYLIFMPRQLNGTIISHPKVVGCDSTIVSGIPVYSGYNWKEDVARRTAVYLPKGDKVLVNLTKKLCNKNRPQSEPDGDLNQGVFSGNVTIIKGRRIRSRPISGRF